MVKVWNALKNALPFPTDTNNLAKHTSVLQHPNANITGFVLKEMPH